MKNTILLTLTLIISYASIGQNGKWKLYTPESTNYLKGGSKIVDGKTSDYTIPIEKLVVKDSKLIGFKFPEFKFNEDSMHVSNFYWISIMPQLGKKTKYYQIGIPEVLNVSGNRDTLEIQSKDIKYIKVDGKVYEIKRSTELKGVVDNYGFKSKLPYTVW